jgi:hypothetical protein
MRYDGREVRVQRDYKGRQRGRPIKGFTYIKDLRPSHERSVADVLDSRLGTAKNA